MVLTISVTFFSLLGVLFGEHRFRKKQKVVTTREHAMLALMSIKECIQSRDFPIREALNFQLNKYPELDKELEVLAKESVFNIQFYSKDLLLIELDGLISKYKDKVQTALNKLEGEHLISIYLGLLVGFLTGLGYGILNML
jgi:hypothetical protein